MQGLLDSALKAALATSAACFDGANPYFENDPAYAAFMAAPTDRNALAWAILFGDYEEATDPCFIAIRGSWRILIYDAAGAGRHRRVQAFDCAARLLRQASGLVHTNAAYPGQQVRVHFSQGRRGPFIRRLNYYDSFGRAVTEGVVPYTATAIRP